MKSTMPLELKDFFLTVDDGEVTKILSDDRGNADVADPVSAILQKATSEGLLKRAAVADESWDAPLVKTAPSSFTRNSNQRFEKFLAVLRKVFTDGTPEFAEAAEIGKRILAEERARVIADSA
jgi:hypothetical protein